MAVVSPYEEYLIGRLRAHLARRHESWFARRLSRVVIQELRAFRSVRVR